MQDIVKERMEESAVELMEAKGGKPRRGTEDWERGLKGVMEIINVMLGSTLDVANSIELDAVDKMKRRGLWCREVKRAGGDVLRRHRLPVVLHLPAEQQEGQRPVRGAAGRHPGGDNAGREAVLFPHQAGHGPVPGGGQRHDGGHRGGDHAAGSWASDL